ncbi:endothelin-converting enzyme-like 1 [Drosophila ficusphila]|uniref:endothelin-converting enzyme-like 1 n=1 Tax=Drosophila ficusphila TaxID=30025 RepID=UPI0007E72C03|nr:endothelin-converting enzyme-like 1 [Drosophila ficusphila]
MMWTVWLLLIPIVSATLSTRRTLNLNARLLNYTLSNLDELETPCYSFLAYACGKYAARHVNDSFDGVFQEMRHKGNHILLEQLENKWNTSDLQGFQQESGGGKVTRFYRSCLNAPAETRTIGHFLRLAPPAEGLTWPLLSSPGDSWSADGFNWMDTLAYLHRYSFTDALFSLDVSQNLLNSSEFLLNIRRPRVYKVFDYEEAQRVLRELQMPFERMKTLLRQLTKFDWDVVNLPRNRSGLGQIMTVGQLKDITGYDWLRFIGIIYNQDISLDQRVKVNDVQYFKDLHRIINSTSHDLLANYIMIRFALYLQEVTDGALDSIGCVLDVRRNFYVASSWLIEREEVSYDDFLKVKALFNNVRQQLLLRIESNRLGLTAEQQEMVSRKIQATSLNINDFNCDGSISECLDEYYRELEIPVGDQDFAREHLNLLQFRTAKKLAKLHDPQKVIFVPEINSVQSSKPYYVSGRNMVVVPIDLLLDPFFLLDSHDVFNYGSMGFALARELMRAVDGENILYDADGNLYQIGYDIWNLPQFFEALSCNNDNNNYNNRIADIGGLKLAYSAYLESVKGLPNNFGIDHIINVDNDRLGNYEAPRSETNLSLQQVFFLNLAQSFCRAGVSSITNYEDDTSRLGKMVVGFEPFHRAFECEWRARQCEMW